MKTDLRVTHVTNRTRIVQRTARQGCRWLVLAVVSCLLISATTTAHAVDTDALRRKQDAQERARDMAKQLVTGVLDIQLQQLEENGLKQLPLYREIASMRKNIGALVDRDMEQAVELLVKAQHGSEEERDAAFRQARQMIRQIVTRLMTERQNLMRRLKTAEIAAQVQRLITVETRVWQSTRTIPEQVPAKQETLALAAIEDQGDVKQLFLQLVETLADVSQWGGPLGTGATEGLQILQAAGVGQELDTAGAKLAALAYPEAAASQLRVIKGLRLLLEKLNDTQNQLGADRHTGVALVRDLIEKQEKVREQSRQADLTQPDAERLVEEQANIRKELNNLSQALGQIPAAETLLEQAKAAAYEATGKLFDARADEAVAEQQKVLANLAGIAEQMTQAADVAQTDISSPDAARRVRDLEQARADLERIRQDQAQADRSAQENAVTAGTMEQQVAQNLAKVDDNRSLPRSVMTRLAAAELAAAAAAKALTQGPAAKATPQQQETLEQADRAVERAAAEISAALDDARRMEQGVAIGELARAAETLERAAAAERNMAREALQAAQKSGLDTPTAGQMSQRQADVAAIAKAVADSVSPLAGEAGQSAAAAAQAAAESKAQLDQAAAKPGEASKPQAQAAGQAAANAASKLAQAAAQIREQIGKSAEKLSAEAAQQLGKVTPVRESVDQAVAQSESSVTEKMQNLAAAEQAIRAAQVAQQRAAGRPAAAEAMELADALGRVQENQSRADQAARQLASGKLSSPLETITREQAVAEKSAALAAAAAKRPQASQNADKPDALADALRDASRAASRAAKATLDNDQTQAQASRDQARQALDRAAHLAMAEAEQAAAQPAGKPDAGAQKEVSAAIADAEKMTPAEAAPAQAALTNAAKSSSEAQRQAEDNQADAAQAAQQDTAKSLGTAAQELKAVREQLAQEQMRQLAEQASQADQLAQKSVPADPSALAALRDAQSRSKQGAAEPPAMAQRATEARQQARQDLQRAAANLTAREQRLERDKAIADAVKELVKNQAEAAADIAAQSADLLAAGDDAQPAAGDEPGAADAKDSPSNAGNKSPAGKSGKSSQRRQAAERLSQAQRNFAQAQRGTGEAAEEVTGQSGIGNKPLRDAMARASKLVPSSPEGASAGQDPQEGAADAAQPMPEGANRDLASQFPDDSADLGTGFIPNSPEATAEMMAGPEAAARAARELGSQHLARNAGRPLPDDLASAAEASANNRDRNAPEQANEANDNQPSQNKSRNSANSRNQESETPDNPELKQGPPQTDPLAAQPPEAGKPAATNRDVEFSNRGLTRETWFAKLPPDLRKAIRARAQRPPPRSYEDKLQRYFESID